MADFRYVGVPIVVRGALAEHEFVRNWMDEEKVKEMAREEEKLASHRKYTVYSPEPDGCLNQSDRMQECAVSFNRFIQLAEKETTRPLYLLGVPDVKGKHGASPLEQLACESIPPVFSRHLVDDRKFFFYDFYKEATAVRRNVFFNSGYCFTNLHFDSDANAYLCASGRRRWSLCHPRQAQFLTHDKPNSNRSTLRPTTKDFSKFPLASLIKFVHISLQPGDVLLVPSGWWHVVEGGVDQLPGSFSCGVNWFYELPVLHEQPEHPCVPLATPELPACTSVLQQKLQILIDSLQISDPQQVLSLYGAASEAAARLEEAHQERPAKKRVRLH